MLLKGGIPVVQTIEILADTSDNAVYKEIMHKIADDIRQEKLFRLQPQNIRNIFRRW